MKIKLEQGRFTAGIKEQRIRLPNISLSPHDKPQTIGLMNGSKVIEHGKIIGGKYATSKSYIPRVLNKMPERDSSTATEVSANASFDAEAKLQQKTLTLRFCGFI